MRVYEYQTVDGRIPVREWLEGLTDTITRARIVTRLDRLVDGSKGDWKFVGEGVFELRLHFGPGYRIYYAHDGALVILLLLGGEKRTQSKDIEIAHAYWKDYKTRRC